MKYYLELNPNGLSELTDLLPAEFEIEVNVTTNDRYSIAKENVKELLKQRGIILLDGVVYSYIEGTYKLGKLIGKCLFLQMTCPGRIS